MSRIPLLQLSTRRTAAEYGTALAAVALAAAATAAFDRTAVRLVLALASLLLLALPLAPRLGQRISGANQTRLLMVLAAAAASHGASLELWQLSSSPWVRVWNVYHYYLGAEYFEELGYFDLYDATLRADREGADYWRGIHRVRNLRTYQVEPRALGEARFDPRDRFSDQRWQEFREDVAALQTQLPPRRWRSIFRDRGYNPPPLWTFVGQRLTAWLPATSLVALKILVSLDLLLLVMTFRLIYRTFGDRSAFLVLLFIALSPVNTARLVGGFLQYDWFCAIAAATCFLQRDKPIAAAAAMAYAAMSRAFPLILVVSALLPVATFWVQHGKIRRPSYRFFLAFGLFCLLGLGLGSLTGRGPAAWAEFAASIGHHSEEHTYGQRRVGLKHWFTHDLTTWSFDEGAAERREQFARQRPLYQATAALGFAAFGLAAYRRRRQDALLLGLVPLFLLTASSRYYWACLALLPLMSRVGLGGRKRVDRLNLAQAGLYGGFYLFTWLQPDRYASYSFFNLLMIFFLALLLGTYLAREAKARRRRRNPCHARGNPEREPEKE